MEWITNCEKETEQLGERLGAALKPGSVIAYTGDLGAGKTAFTRGLAKGLQVPERVTSPTFNIVNEYEGRVPVRHFDVYRIEDEDDLYSTGFYDYMDGVSVLFIEWSENIEYALPEDRITVTILKTESGRTIEVSGLEGR